MLGWGVRGKGTELGLAMTYAKGRAKCTLASKLLRFLFLQEVGVAIFERSGYRFFSFFFLFYLNLVYFLMFGMIIFSYDNVIICCDSMGMC